MSKLVISSQLPALSVEKYINEAAAQQTKVFAKLASGRRITQAADDPAGLAISEKLNSEIHATTQAGRNAQDGVSVVQIAEGALTEVNNLSVRLKELSIQAANDTLSKDERKILHQEAHSLIQEIDRIANTTQYNKISLLNGSDSEYDQLKFFVNTHSFPAGQSQVSLDLHLLDSQVKTLGLSDVNLETADHASDSIEIIDQSIQKTLDSRAQLGAILNRLQSIGRVNDAQQDALTQAHSQITDADLIKEASELVSTQIRMSAGMAVLAQTKSLPEQALRLIS